MKKTILSTLLFALVVSLSFVSCKKKEKEKEPEPTVETNYISINGTKYNLNTNLYTDDELKFSGSLNGNYPNVFLNFGSNSLPSTTTTYSCVVKVNKSMSANDSYQTTMDLTIVVNNGEYSVTLPSTTIENINKNGESTITGNITVKK